MLSSYINGQINSYNNSFENQFVLLVSHYTNLVDTRPHAVKNTANYYIY